MSHFNVEKNKKGLEKKNHLEYLKHNSSPNLFNFDPNDSYSQKICNIRVFCFELVAQFCSISCQVKESQGIMRCQIQMFITSFSQFLEFEMYTVLNYEKHKT